MLYFVYFLDIYKTSESYIIQTDMPGVAPETDLVVQSSTDGNKLVIKGERKRVAPLLPLPDEGEGLSSIIVQRPFGAFTIEVALPINTDISRTEQTYSHGVLTITVPLKHHQWRTLNILQLSPESHIVE
jgi:HSP20 family protein